MPLGYDGKLYILAFDHRGSFQKKWFGLGDEITQEDTDRIADAKTLIDEGLELALGQGADASITGALVDEQFGGDVPQRAKDHGIKLAMPVEKSGQNEFDFQYGDDFDRYDSELRPELMRRAIAEIQDFGIEVDIWKIEGVDEQSDCQMLAEQSRAGGRDGVVCVLLGRGASDEKVDHWLRQAAPVEGFIGFAIGRSIWGDALTGYINGSLERDVASKQVAENYLRFVKVYEDAEAAQPAGA